MPRFPYTVVSAASLVILAAQGAAAQRVGFPEVRPGEMVQDSLDSADARLSDGKRFDVFQFQARAGRRYSATMESPAFDPYLVLARTTGGITEHLKEDDDGGDGVSARLRFTVPADGTYLLVARGLSPQATGRFILNLEDEGEIVVPPPVPVRVGETVQGSLDEEDGYLDEGEKSYDLYLVRGSPGEDVHVRLVSGAFDAYLETGELVNGYFRPEQSNDDYQGRNSALQVRLGQRGDALVRATSLAGNQHGPYTFSVHAGKLPPRDANGEEQSVVPAEDLGPATPG